MASQKQKTTFQCLALLLVGLCGLVSHESRYLPQLIAGNLMTTEDSAPQHSSEDQQQSQQQQQHRSFVESRLERTDMYKERYQYHSPEHYVNHSYREEVCGSQPPFEKYFTQEATKLRSANNEDKSIYNIFFAANRTKGSVIEIGAFDGKTESNSRFFDFCLGWDTLLVEANPLKWEQLILNRPHAHRLSYAPSCSHEEEMNNKTLQFTHSIWTNAALESVKSAYSGKNLTTYDVPCGSLTKVIHDLLNGHVTFFSLDVEGAEPMIVNNIDFDNVFIEILMIETFNGFCKAGQFCQSRNDFRKRMRDTGYLMFEHMVSKSDVFIHPRSQYVQSAHGAGYKETPWAKANLV